MKRIVITIPDNCKVQIVEQSKEDKENKEDKKIKTYQDLIDNNYEITGFHINDYSQIKFISGWANNDNKNVASSEKVAKSMLAMAMISQLMPYYGGEITDEEWKNIAIMKYSFLTRNNNIVGFVTAGDKCFFAFHTEKQRDDFLNCNKQLVKDYLMID